MRQRPVRTDQCLGIFRHGALTRQLGRTGFERNTEGIENRLAADGPDRTRGDENVEHGAEQQRTDQADRNVPLWILGFLRRGRNCVEPDISEEHRRSRADRADTGTPATENTGREERIEPAHIEIRAGQRNRDKRSDEHTTELQSLMRTSSAVFYLKKKKNTTTHISYL